jgi:hypothetical protein
MRAITKLMLRGAAMLLAGALAAGCGGKKTYEPLEELKNDFNLQLSLLKRHSDFLEKKVVNVETKLAKVDASTDSLAMQIEAFVTGPDRVQREILAEVDAQTTAADRGRENYMAALRRRLDERDQDLNHRADEAIGRTTRVLTDRDRFFRYVFTAQDSVNGIFASRFDQRPWYQSVIGRWEGRRPSE